MLMGSLCNKQSKQNETEDLNNFLIKSSSLDNLDYKDEYSNLSDEEFNQILEEYLKNINEK